MLVVCLLAGTLQVLPPLLSVDVPVCLSVYRNFDDKYLGN